MSLKSPSQNPQKSELLGGQKYHLGGKYDFDWRFDLWYRKFLISNKKIGPLSQKLFEWEEVYAATYIFN